MLRRGNPDEAVSETLKSTIIQVAAFRTAGEAEGTRVALLFLDLKARVIPPSAINGGGIESYLVHLNGPRHACYGRCTDKNGYSALVRRE